MMKFFLKIPLRDNILAEEFSDKIVWTCKLCLYNLQILLFAILLIYGLK